MKKSIITKISVLFVACLSLSGCDFINRFLNPETIFDNGYIDDDPSYRPDKNPKDAVYPSYTYNDYISNNYYPKSSMPVKGTSKMLVIPIWFNDSHLFINENDKDALKEDIRLAYFGSEEETGWHSVASYYENESTNLLDITGTVSTWYEPDISYSYIAGDVNDSHTITVNLLKNATNWYFENSEESTKDYDADGDGYLDGVVFIYAAPNWMSLKHHASNPDSITENRYGNLWAYCFWADGSSNKDNPGLNVFFWASYDFMFDHRNPQIGEYGYGDSGYTVDAHTYIHESGHMFGLDDYYDYGNDKYSPAGGFSMQDETVGAHDPFSTYSLGWAKAYIPVISGSLRLTPFQKDKEIIILTPNFNKFNSPFDEYLILEFYDPSNLNEKDAYTQYMSSAASGARQPGIRLWHVDARLLFGNTESSFYTSKNITTNPLYNVPPIGGKGGVYMMNSNTYDSTNGHATKVREPKANLYNILQLIHADNPSDALHTKLRNNSIFTEGLSFSMEAYSSQFVNGTKLNSGLDLGFNFTVKRLTKDYAEIEINKL